MAKKSAWYLSGFEDGVEAANVNLAEDPDGLRSYYEKDRLGEYAGEIREHQSQFAGDISYEVGRKGGPTERQFEQWDEGFTDGFIQTVERELKVRGSSGQEYRGGAVYGENPRKSHTEIVRAFLEHRKRSISHFATDGERLLVHGNLVAEHRPEGIYVTDSGWHTALTKGVLNELMDVADGFGYASGQLAQERGEWLFAPIVRGVPDWNAAVPWTGSAILAPVSRPVGY